MSKKPNYKKNLERLNLRSVEYIAELEQIERNAIANFTGQMEQLEAALGMLRIGDHFGWKVLVLIHNKRTLKKYEEILGIKVKEFFDEEGPSWERSRGYYYIKKLGNFWKGVSGEIKIEDKREIKE